MVLAYMTRMATQEWVCQTTMDYSKMRPFTKSLIYRPGVTYFGLPYVGHHNGVELFGSLLDANKVYLGPVSPEKCRGVTCAGAVKVAYRTVSPSVSFTGTPNILPHARRGTVAVGDYAWEVDTPPPATLTADIIRRSTSNAVFEAYARVQPADALAARWKSGSALYGHARLVSSLPAVVRDGDGRILPLASHVHTIEQCGSFNKEAACRTTWRVGRTYTFAELIGKGYVPLTLEEFKTGKLAEAKIRVAGLTEPEHLGSSNRLKGSVTSNFVIHEIDATIFRADGSPAATARAFPESTVLSLEGVSFDQDVTALPPGRYRFVLTIRIGYGDSVGADLNFTRN
jgi:hypothetical protein